METCIRARSLLDPPIVRRALIESSLSSTPGSGEESRECLWSRSAACGPPSHPASAAGYGEAPPGFILAISLWL